MRPAAAVGTSVADGHWMDQCVAPARQGQGSDGSLRTVARSRNQYGQTVTLQPAASPLYGSRAGFPAGSLAGHRPLQLPRAETLPGSCIPRARTLIQACPPIAPQTPQTTPPLSGHAPFYPATPLTVQALSCSKQSGPERAPWLLAFVGSLLLRAIPADSSD